MIRAAFVIVVALLGLTLDACSGCGPPAGKKPDAGPGACAVGTKDCPCDGASCNAGLVCTDAVCKEPASSGLKIESADARACEALLHEKNGKVTSVVFSSSVTGRVITEGDKTSIAFHANNDAAMGNDSVVVSFTGSVDSIDQALDLVAPRCFNRAGAALPGGGLSF